MFLFKRATALAVLAAFLIGLAAPAPSYALFSEMTVKDEIEMGKKFDEMLRQHLQIVHDPEIVDYVSGVVERIVAKMPPQPFPVKTTVVLNNTMNAFAVPGGYVYVFTGLLLELENEAQLASILAHELAHVALRHVADRAKQMQLASVASILGMLGGALLGVVGGGSNMTNLGQALAVGSMAGANSAYLVFTRENEREADQVGMNYHIASGYNPQEMVNSFEIIRRKKWYMSGTDIPTYLSTHPGIPERMDYLQDRVDRLPKEVTQREAPNDKYSRVQALVWAKYTPPDIAYAHYMDKMKNGGLDCAENLGLAIVYERMRKTSKAGEYFENAMICGGDDPIMLRETGIYYFKQGKFQKAAMLLQRCLGKTPGDLIATYYYARLLGDLGQYQSAIAYLKRVVAVEPHDPELRYHMGRYYGQAGDMFEAHLNLAYSQLYGKNPKKARFHLEKAQELASTEAQKEELEELEQAVEKRL